VRVRLRVLAIVTALAGLMAVTGATAALPRHVTLTVSIMGKGAVRLGDGRRIGCSATRCRKTFLVRAGAKLNLTARPSSGWAFAAWSGTCQGGRATCTLRPRRANSVAATFAPPGSTRANPIPLGQTAPIADGFRLKVVSATPDAQLSVPAPVGAQNFVVLLTATYDGGGKGGLLPLINNLDARGTHNATYTTYENGCHAPLPPPTLGESGFDIFSGQSVTGNICWQIARNDATSLVLFIGSGFTHTTWFALR
jgi:Divergent InlB B-repeat domain